MNPTQSSPHQSVAIIGGGLAGLSAGVFLASEGRAVRVLESSQKYGGRAYSYHDRILDATIDNSTHMLAPWYGNMRDYTELIGAADLFQVDMFEAVLADSTGCQYSIKAPSLPPPLHLVTALLRCKAFKASDRIAIFRLGFSLMRRAYSDDELRSMTVADIYRETQQTHGAIFYFWEPIVVSVFNARPQDVSAYLFADVIRRGFTDVNGSAFMLAKVPLSEALVDPGVRFLQKRGANVENHALVSKVVVSEDRVSHLRLKSGAEVRADAYLSTVPFHNLSNILGGDENVRRYVGDLSGLKSSPIVCTHIQFRSDVSDVFGRVFVALLGTEAQIAFLTGPKQVCVITSAADTLIKMTSDSIIRLTTAELRRCLPALVGVEVEAARVVKAKKATFLPNLGSLTDRPGHQTKLGNFFIAGDWTATGYSHGIESAVTSGREAAKLIRHYLESRPAVPEALHESSPGSLSAQGVSALGRSGGDPSIAPEAGGRCGFLDRLAMLSSTHD